MAKRKSTDEPKPAPDKRAVNARGQEWQAKQLTGNRALSNPPAANDIWPAASEQGHQKRRKVSAASFFIPRIAGAAQAAAVPVVETP